MVKRKKLGKSILALLMALCLLAGTVQTSTVVYATEMEEAASETEEPTSPAAEDSQEEAKEEAEDETEEDGEEAEESAEEPAEEEPVEAEQVEDASEEELTEAEKVQEDLGQDDQTEEAVKTQEDESEIGIDLEYVQALINSLPDADSITEENASEVEALLDEIDTAKLSLTADELDSSLDYKKYDAACAALKVLAGGVASVAVAAADELPADALTEETYLWSTLTNPAEDENGDVTLTVVTTEGETDTYQYDNIMDAVKKLFSYMDFEDNYQTNDRHNPVETWYYPGRVAYYWKNGNYTWNYTSAIISFTGEHCEYITTSVEFRYKVDDEVYVEYACLNNVTFDGNGTGSIVGDPAQSYDGNVVVSGGSYGSKYGYGAYDNLKGTLNISGNNCTVQNINFVGNHTWVFTYYTEDNAIGVDPGVTDLTIKNNYFSGYTLVTAFGQQLGDPVTNEVFTGNTVENCLFLFHTADGGATNLTVTDNTLIGSPTYTLASCMAYTTVANFSGNTLTYASFGLQNCDTDMEQFLNQNTYDHGFIYQETVDYSSDLGYYYLPSSTTVMTVVPDGYYAVWKSDYNKAGQVDSDLTYTQQDAIGAAIENSEDATYAKLTWTGGGTDESGNALDGGVAIGYNYNALHLNYARPVASDEPEIDKTATELNENDKTTVTLTVGSSEDTLKVAVLFVLDYSTSTNVRNAAKDMLKELGTKDKVDLKVAVVNYYADAQSRGWYDYSSLPDDYLDKLSTEGGTNYHGGLLKAKELLESEDIEGYTTYLITISDGITYLYTDEETGTTMSVYTDIGNTTTNTNEVNDYRIITEEIFNTLVTPTDSVISAFKSTDAIAEVWSTSTKDYREKSVSEKYVTTDEFTSQTKLSGSEIAIYKTTSLYRDLLEIVDYAYAFALDENHWSQYPYGEMLMDYLANISDEGSGEITDSTAKKVFEGIENHILYTIESGTVTDVIGNDFDLVGLDTFTLKVGGETYDKTIVGDTVYFGTAQNGVYPYQVTYYKTSETEYFVWKINVPVESANGLELSYDLKLVSISDADGKHTVPTNESAVIEYEPTEGDPGDEEFPVPTVTYTTISVKVEKVWSDGSNQDQIRPESVTVQLLRNGTETGATLILNSNNNWSGSFTKLRLYEGETADIYTVSESAVAGYTTAVTGDASTGYTITNTHTVTTTVEEDPGDPADTETAEDPADPQEAESTVAAEVVSAVTGDNAPIGIAILIAAISEIALITLIILQVRKKKDEVI